MNPIVVIAASAGGLEPLKQIVAALPDPCAASVFIVWHTGPLPSLLPQILSTVGRLPVSHPDDGTLIQTGHVYVAPPDHHMTLELGRIRLDQGPKVNHVRPAADPLFLSAAEIYREHVIGIVLSGGDGDGAAGLRAIKGHGGIAFVQKPEEAENPSMPYAAIMADHPDACLPVAGIAERIAALCPDSLPPGRPSDEPK
ncbi:chemotaxis protein CheB [Microvirga lotononidis]|uniref:protein-glutamate methylesterase n=1 Tax=Microvirga lotononidis TaxID=864069 RepID=I4YRH2_9HYPH|nr:chemotaxis protein CheB [Microvirga lotononidis]EIM26564.1 chemotaxis response regulator containing a CheY-like receiver domain and a methylesterase domain [Microvirga lotononidis]WQO31245.1 chemotaxis protein CheB [Microvirga lotononidis]